MKTDTFLSNQFQHGRNLRSHRSYSLREVGWSESGGLDCILKSEDSSSKGVRLFVDVPDLGWLMTLALLVVASPLVCYGLARWKKDDSFLVLANRAVFLSILLQVMALAMFLMRALIMAATRHSMPTVYSPPKSCRESVHPLRPGRWSIHLLTLFAVALAASGSGSVCCPAPTTWTASPTKLSLLPSPS